MTISISEKRNPLVLSPMTRSSSRRRSTVPTSASMSRPEENLHYWKLLAEENGCYDRPYPFTSDHARFVFFRQREPNLYYVPHEDFACDVTVLSGLPGSGKDTWLQRNGPDLTMVSLEGIHSSTSLLIHGSLVAGVLSLAIVGFVIFGIGRIPTRRCLFDVVCHAA